MLSLNQHLDIIPYSWSQSKTWLLVKEGGVR